jgi:hypothetical protein
MIDQAFYRVYEILIGYNIKPTLVKECRHIKSGLIFLKNHNGIIESEDHFRSIINFF